jgi:hypothetical protein
VEALEAANSPNAVCIFLLAGLSDPSLQKERLQASSELGFPYATAILGAYFTSKRDEKLRLLKIAADAGDGFGECMYGLELLKGQRVNGVSSAALKALETPGKRSSDHLEALQYLERAAEKGERAAFAPVCSAQETEMLRLRKAAKFYALGSSNFSRSFTSYLNRIECYNWRLNVNDPVFSDIFEFGAIFSIELKNCEMFPKKSRKHDADATHRHVIKAAKMFFER